MKTFTLFLGLCLLSNSAIGMPIESYSKAKLEQYQTSGQSVALQYHASWCPVCKKQKNSLEAISKDKDFEKTVLISADYDSETELKKAYNVTGQSTVILFKGKKEVARVVGMTDAMELRQFLKQSDK